MREWNETGYCGLTFRFAWGPKPKIANSEWDRLSRKSRTEGWMTLKEVAVYVRDTRGCHYYKDIREALRKKRYVSYGKAF